MIGLARPGPCALLSPPVDRVVSFGPMVDLGASSTDEQLMEAYVAGNERALREIFDRYAPVILRVMLRQGLSEAEANDVVQQTFLQVHRAKYDFRLGAALRPWVFTIAFNLGRQHFRRRRTRREVGLETHDAPPPTARSVDSVRLSEERARQVRDAIASLPEGQREVVVLHWLEERPFAEVASIVGATETAVKVRAHRAYERLRAVLKDVFER